MLKNSDPGLSCSTASTACGTAASWIDPELAERASAACQAPGKWPAASRWPRASAQLIGFVRKGLRNREIAEQLGVTEGTVKVYLHAIFEKLGVSSRTELAIRADEFLAVP